MEETWHADFLTSRHVHNRHSRNHAFQSANSADINKAFGSYDLKCSAAESLAPVLHLDNGHGPRGRKNKHKKKQPSCPRLDIHSLTDKKDGLVGEMFLPGVLNASIFMAGSRKQLQEILEIEESSKQEVGQEEGSQTPQGSPENHTYEENSQIDHSLQYDLNNHVEHDTARPAERTKREANEHIRFRNFEENTFRQPKFWLSWQGNVLVHPDSSTNPVVATPSDQAQSGMGYIVFSGNKYQKFKGTINCDILGWKDVALSGWKR